MGEITGTQAGKLMQRLWSKLLLVMSLPVLLAEFFDGETGREYGVGFLPKVRLALRMARNRKTIPTASHFLEHLMMATEVLKVPKATPGSVVECGTFKGGSATSLSLVCELCDRKLDIFDSFEGLPEPNDEDREHKLLGTQTIHSYEHGTYRGTLPEVQRNIAAYGCIEACRFNAGYFDQSLPNFGSSCVLVFADVDLTASLETCLRYLWPLLQERCCFFTHEAQHLEISALFYDQPWWRSHLNCSAPGLIGAGTGIGLLPESGGYRSNLAYTIKNPGVKSFIEEPQTGILV
jgi:O-methyltransferase